MGKQLNTDIRIDIGFLRNLKTMKFSRSLNGNLSDPIVCILRLWLYCAERHKKGVMHGMDAADLEAAAGWTGMQGAFYQHATSMHWVDVEHDGTLKIHDWDQQQPYVYHHDRRSEIARKGATAKWKKKRNQTFNAVSNAVGNATSNAGSNAPSPTPTPTPIPRNIGFVLPPIINPETWQGFEEMRNRIKKPMTNKARKLIIGKLKKLGDDPNRILEESIMSGWAGVFPLKEKGGQKQPVDCLGRAI